MGITQEILKALITEAMLPAPKNEPEQHVTRDALLAMALQNSSGTSHDEASAANFVAGYLLHELNTPAPSAEPEQPSLLAPLASASMAGLISEILKPGTPIEDQPGLFTRGAKATGRFVVSAGKGIVGRIRAGQAARQANRAEAAAQAQRAQARADEVAHANNMADARNRQAAAEAEYANARSQAAQEDTRAATASVVTADSAERIANAFAQARRTTDGPSPDDPDVVDGTIVE